MNNIKELIRKEIERLRKDIKGYDDWTLGFESACERILDAIDTLPDEPVTDCHDLEKEISTWIPAHISGGDNEVCRDTKNAVTEWARIVARHFAEWQKRKMMEGAVEADVNTYRNLEEGTSWAEFVVEMPINNLCDKVKIIIVKEEE